MNPNQEYYNFMNISSALQKLFPNLDTVYLRWLKDIMNTKIGMFTYEGLPDELTSQIVEQALLFRNNLCWYYDKATARVVLASYRFGAEYNIYWKPTRVDIFAFNGTMLASAVPYEDIVLLRDNTMDIIPFLTLSGWLDKIIEQEKTLDVLVRLVRFPLLLEGSKEEIASLKTMLQKALNFEPYIIGNKLKEHIDQFNIALPVTLEEVYNLLKKYKDLALASIGIYSVDEKQERIVTSEIMAQNDYVDFVYSNMANERKQSIAEANAKFGTHIKLIETYVENKKSEQDITLDSVDKQTEIEKQAQIEIEKIKNEGKVDAAKESAKGGTFNE